MKPSTFNLDDAFQGELFVAIWRTKPPRQFRLHAGDVVRYEGRLCRVIRVNECSAVLIANQKAKEFKTIFDKQVRFQPRPITFRIYSNSELPILNP